MKKLLSIVGPGMLVAATGAGAGDLLTASLGGSAVGLAIIWAAPLGAVLKWYLNEGIARWRMATGQTVLEGWIAHLGDGFNGSSLCISWVGLSSPGGP